jgi:membrane associated rhomboid family serine protease
MFQRQRSGAVVCPNCGRLVGVNNRQCPHCGQASPGLFGYARALQGLAGGEAFVPLVMGACALAYVFCLLMGFRAAAGGPMSFLSPSIEALTTFGASGWVPVFELGRWWTPLSANWLHGSLLHIIFNLMWIRQLAPAVIRMYGVGRTMLIYLLGGSAGFVLTSCVGHWLPNLPRVLMGAPITVGASASIFGLFGALILYGRRTGSRAIGRQVWTWVGFILVIGLVLPGIDNWAHLGGFAGGYVVASVLNPLTPERPEHLAAALALLAVSLLAVVGSLLAPLP